VYFEPFLALQGGKTLKDPFGAILGTFGQLIAIFAIFFVFFGHF
jgi:hypothetical protein